MDGATIAMPNLVIVECVAVCLVKRPICSEEDHVALVQLAGIEWAFVK